MKIFDRYIALILPALAALSLISASAASSATSLATASPASFAASSAAPAAQQGENEAPKPEELAEKEAARLESMLKLEDWQVFYVDSTLRHDYAELMRELEQMQRARVENSELYFAVNDKWMETIQAAYKKFFTPEQWNEYLKQEGSKLIKDREKRRAKAAGVDLKAKSGKQDLKAKSGKKKNKK